MCDGTQTPWLLSLQGELVASLEDASLMGLYVDISATMVTIQSPRQDLLQGQQVLNNSVQLLPLWLVSSHCAYSLEAVCPPVSSQPGSEVLVHIPRKSLGLVKRGFHFEEALSLKSLRVHQVGTFAVTESRDFLVVRIPGAALLRVQPCQEPGGAPGKQAFYSVDLSLEFAESATAVLWTVENYFRCGASPRTTPFRAPLDLGTPPAGSPSSASSQSPDADPATGAQPEPRPVLHTAKPAGGSWVSAAGLPTTASQDGCCPQAPPGETGPPRTLSSGLPGAAQAGPEPSQPVSPASTAPATHPFLEAASPLSPFWKSDPSEVSLGSESLVTLTEGPQQDPVHSPGSPPLPAGVDVAVIEPTQAGKEFQPLTRPWVTRLTDEALGSHHPHRTPQETSSMRESEGPPESDRDLSGGVSRLEGSSSKLSQGVAGPRPTILPGTDAVVTTEGKWQPDTSSRLGTSGPKQPGGPRGGPSAALTGLPENSMASTSKRPETQSVGASDSAPDLGSAPEGTVGWHGWGTPTPGPLPLGSLSPAKLRNPFPTGHRALPPQDPPEAMLAASPENPGTPELPPSVEGAL